MKKVGIWILVIVLILLIVGLIWYFTRDKAKANTLPTLTVAQQTAVNQLLDKRKQLQQEIAALQEQVDQGWVPNPNDIIDLQTKQGELDGVNAQLSLFGL